MTTLKKDTFIQMMPSQGLNGYNTATIYLYQRSTSTVTSKPNRILYYKFSTKTLYTDSACTTPLADNTTNMNGWLRNIPSGTNPIWITAAVANSREDVDAIEISPTNEWVTPVEMAESGGQGEHGINSAVVFIYKRSENQPDDTPTGRVTYTFASGNVSLESGKSWNNWSTTIPSSDGNPCWVKQAAALGIGATDVIETSDWSATASKLVEDGDDGNGIASVTRTYAISTQSTTASETTAPTISGSWASSSPAVTAAYPYLWAKEVVTYTKSAATTKYYMIGARGENGVDAQDIEWVFIRTKTSTPPTILNDNTYSDSHSPSRDYTKDGHLPHVSGNENIENNQNTYECTDDPKGVTDYWLYEWEIKRTKGDANQTTGTRTWNYYSGSMTLHNNYAESAFIIDIDNDNDQFGTDSNSDVLVQQQRTTIVRLYDGATPQTLNADNASTPGVAAVLKYIDDDSSVPSTIAEVSCHRDTQDNTKGVVEVTFHDNVNFANSGVYATITAACAKGEKNTVFTIRKVMSGAAGLTPIIYQVEPTNKVFSFQRDASNNLTPVSNSNVSQINVARTEGNTTTILNTAQTGLTYDWGFDDSSAAQGSNQAIGSTITVSSSDAASHSSVWVQLSTGDKETLAIVKDGAKGAKGDSITKSGEVSTYKVSDSGTTTPTGTWYATKAAANTAYPWTEDRYMWTKTVITWSDTSTTTLYSAERNPNDGNAGQDIVVDEQEIKYSKQSYGTLDPSTLTYGNYPSTLSKGDWLYVRTTVYYKKEDSASYSHDAGSSVSYTVQYQAKDGDTGRSLSGITEHYKASSSNSSSQWSVPSSGTWSGEWGTSPIPSDFNSSKKYLWNYEKIEYLESDGATTTIERTSPSIITTYGKAIDSIVNYYKASTKDGSSLADSESLPETDPTGSSSSDGWTIAVQTPTSSVPFLWNYERINYIDTNGSTSVEHTDPHIICHFGEDGTSPWIADFDNEMDSVACDSSQKPIAQQVITTNVNLYYGVSKKQFYITSIKRNGGTSGSYGTGVTVTPSTSSSTYYTDATITVTYATTATISNKDIFEITLKSKDDGTITRVLNLTVNGIVGDARYNLVPSDNIVSKATNGTYSPSTITCSYTKYDVAKRAFVSSPTGGTIKYTKDGGRTEYSYTIGTTTLTAGGSGNTGFTQSVTFLLYVNQVVVDKETIQIVEDGISGTSPIIADIDNEMDAVSVDKLGYIPQVSTTEGGVTYAAKLQTTAKLWEGSSPKSFTLKVYNESGSTEYTNNGSYSGGIKVVYTSDSRTSNTITFYFQAGASIGDKKVFRIVLNSTYIVYFTVNGINGDIYQLLPNMNEVVFGVDGTTNEWTPTTGIDVYCGYTRNVGGTITEYVGTDRANTCKSNASYTEGGTTKYGTAPYNIFFRYQNADSSWGSWSWNKDKTSGTINIPNSTTYVAIQFVLSSATGTGSITEDKIIDKETLPITKAGKTGDSGTSPFIADLDNEMDSVALTYQGKVDGTQAVETNVSMFHGVTPITPNTIEVYDGTESSANKYTSGTPKGGITVTISGQKITASFANNTDLSSYEKKVFLIKLIDSTDDVTRYLNFTVHLVCGAADGTPATIYNILPSLTEVSVGRNDDNSFAPRYNTLRCGWQKKVGINVDTYTEASGNIDSTYRLFFRRRNRSNQTWESTYYYYNYSTYNRYLVVTSGYSTSGLDVATYDTVEFLIYKNTSSNSIAVSTVESSSNRDKIEDKETVSVISDGVDGTSPFIADLDNEMDSVACDKNGKVKASTTCGTNVSLFYGSSKRSYKITSITKNGSSTMGTGVTVKIDDSTPSYPTSASKTHTVSVTYATTATISSKDDFAITIQDATDTSITRVLHFTINGVREGANGEPAIIFRLNPNVSEIVKKKNGTYIPSGTSKVTCAVLKTTGSETSEEPINEIDDYVAKYKLNGTGDEIAFPIGGITVSTITSKLEIFLYNADGDVLLDKETVPLVEDGDDGENGDTPVSVFAWNTSPNVAPSISGNSYPPTGWSVTAPKRPTVTVTRSISTASWGNYGTVGRSDTWTYTLTASDDLSVGDWFVIKGKATDGEKKYHIIFSRCTAKSSSSITGTCQAHYVLDQDTDEYFLWESKSTQHKSSSGTLSYDAWGSPIRVSGDTGQGGLSIAITPSTLVVNTDENGVTEAASQDFTLKVYKGKDEVPVAEYTVTHSSLPNSDWTWTGLYYNAFRIQCASGATFEIPTAITITVALSSGGSIQTSVLLVPNKKGADGASPYRIDLTNDMDAIQYADDVMAGSSVATTAKLYLGTRELELTTDYTLSYSPTGCTASRIGQVITVSALSAERGYVVITATLVSDNTKTFSAVFTVMRLQNKDKFYIQTDKQVIPINTDTTSSSTTFPINIKVYRDGINPQSKKVETSLVQTLGNYGLYLWAGSENPRSYVTTYSSGYTYNMAFSETNVHIYITDNATFGNGTILDHEVIPSVRVQNGQQGEQGKMGRNIYFAGKISELSGTHTVNDYQAPYVDIETGTGTTPTLYVFTGENDTYAWSTDASHYTNPNNWATGESWELMVNTMKYLMTEAFFTDYAKLGSGIFNGDYVFSQDGTIDEWKADINHSFSNPYTCYYPTSSSIKGRDSVSIKNSLVQVNTTTWTAVSDSFTALKGVPYVISFYFASNPNNYYFAVAREQPSSSATGWWSSQWNYARPYNWVTEDSSVKVWCRKRNSSTSSVQIIDIRLTTFVPNLAWNWKTGEIYSQLGHFVNVTVEGVMNNLIQEINNTNMANYGMYNSSSQKFWLNPSKVGSIIRYKVTHPLGLPSAFIDGDDHLTTFLCDYDDLTNGHQMTLNELRQCVGKKIYVLTDGNSSMASIYCGLSNNSSREKQLYDGSSFYYQYATNMSLSNWFYILECKMGKMDGYERIYWQIENAMNKLPNTLAN